MASPRVERFGCFGKLPVSREFIVDGARELGESRFDRWTGEGLGLAKARLGPRFESMIATFPTYRFAWTPGNGRRLLSGVLAPSEDAAGRKHPFSVFAFVDVRAPSLARMAQSLLGPQEKAKSLLATGQGAGSPAMVLESVRAASFGAAELEKDDQAAESRYRSFLSRKASDYWQELAAGESERITILQALVETLEPMRRKDARGFRGGIRFPLALADPVMGACQVRFWLELTERRLGRSPEQGSWFWTAESSAASAGGSATGRGALFLFLTEPLGIQWTSLVDPAVDLESISYLDRPYGGEPPDKRMSPALRALLESGQSVLEEYLRWASGP